MSASLAEPDSVLQLMASLTTGRYRPATDFDAPQRPFWTDQLSAP
jgi:hypothetical protein